MQRMCKANVSLIIRLYLGIHTSEQKTGNPNPADLIAACTKWDSSRGKHTKNTIVGTVAAGGGDRSGAVEGGSPTGGDESAGSDLRDGYGSEKAPPNQNQRDGLCGCRLCSLGKGMGGVYDGRHPTAMRDQRRGRRREGRVSEEGGSWERWKPKRATE